MSNHVRSDVPRWKGSLVGLTFFKWGGAFSFFFSGGGFASLLLTVFRAPSVLIGASGSCVIRASSASSGDSARFAPPAFQAQASKNRARAAWPHTSAHRLPGPGGAGVVRAGSRSVVFVFHLEFRRRTSGESAFVSLFVGEAALPASATEQSYCAMCQARVRRDVRAKRLRERAMSRLFFTPATKYLTTARDEPGLEVE